jgi:hypothetical protein
MYMNSVGAHSGNTGIGSEARRVAALRLQSPLLLCPFLAYLCMQPAADAPIAGCAECQRIHAKRWMLLSIKGSRGNDVGNRAIFRATNTSNASSAPQRSRHTAQQPSAVMQPETAARSQTSPNVPDQAVAAPGSRNHELTKIPRVQQHVVLQNANVTPLSESSRCAAT